MSTNKLTVQEYMRIFMAVLELCILLEVIGYQGLGHWLYGHLWNAATSNEWLIHLIWLMVVNAPVMFWWIVRQIRIERQYIGALGDSEEEFRSLFYHNSEAVVSFDVQGNITNANPALEELTGYSVQELIGLHRGDFLPADKYVTAETHFREALSGTPQEFENTLLHKDGRLIHVNSRNIPIYRGKSVIGVYAILKNITEFKRYEREIWDMAHYDQLTGLANRRFFRMSAEKALAVSAEKSTQLGILFIDLDRFKNINDNLGHDIGDRVLMAIAKRMDRCIPRENVLARMGGDEFALLMPQMRDMEEATGIADQLHNAIKKPLVIDEYEFYVTSTIGISIFPDSGNSVVDLLKAADTAMYDAKRLGRSSTCIQTIATHEVSYHTLKLENDLRKALDEPKGELYVEYQPQVDIKTGKVIGCEALVRWRHPVLGLIQPGKFIPLAEDTGLINQIGEFVARTVCQQIIKWKKQYRGYAIPVSVNISPLQFQHSNFVVTFVGILRKYGVPASLVRIEVTESSLMKDEQLMVKQLQALRDLGIQIFVDDFGKGYSSLAFLKKSPLNGLKIDKFFTQAIDQDHGDASIAMAVVKMAHALRLEVIAEGVEREQQIDILMKCNCDQYQGYLYSRPLGAQDFTNTLGAIDMGWAADKHDEAYFRETEEEVRTEV
jgi:diguanylate cyclase (GGDEF)-like protein/PAS domain S-box-containing protein